MSNTTGTKITPKITPKMWWQGLLGLHIISLYLFTKIKIKMILIIKDLNFLVSLLIIGVNRQVHIERLPWRLLFILPSLRVTLISKLILLYILIKGFRIITFCHKPYNSFKFSQCNVAGYLFTPNI